MEIGLPDEKGRQQILTIHTNKMRDNSFLDRNVDLPALGEPINRRSVENGPRTCVAVCWTAPR